jgi:hypothetical protein
MNVNDKLGRIWKKAAMTYFTIVSQYLPGRTEINYDRTAGLQIKNRSKTL